MADYDADDVYDGYADMDEQTRALIAMQREQARVQLDFAGESAAYDDQNYLDDEEQEEREEEEVMMNAAPSRRAKVVAPTALGAPGQPTSSSNMSGAKPLAKSTSLTRTRSMRSGSAKAVRSSSQAGTLPSPRSRPAKAPGEGETTAPKPKRKVRKERKKVLNCATSKYAIIRELAQNFGFVFEEDETVEKYGFNLLWADTIMPLQKVARLANWQRFNHYPSMHLLCRKGHLGLTLGRMRKAFPEEYSFFPRTWTLRSERSHFLKHLQSLQGKGRPVFIMKPNAGCQGRGIILTRDPLNATEEPENFVVQEYMSKPLLIENKKFDLRVYVLVTSVKHLSIMVFHDGLVRICADAYQKPTDANLANTCIHLTNYAVNKHSENFVFNQDGSDGSVGNKRDFIFLNTWLQSEGHDPAAFWARVDDMVTKAVIAALPKLQHVYNSCFPHGNDGYTCFEVLGFDVLVDEKLRPWLLEVNHTPSFHCDTPLDHRIKHGLLSEVWSIINVNGNDKQRSQAREKMLRNKRLAANLGNEPLDEFADDPTFMAAIDPATVIAAEDSRRKGFRRAYPPADPLLQQKYDLLIRGAREATEEVKITAAQEARVAEVKAERALREAKLENERALMQSQSFIASGSSPGFLPPAGSSSLNSTPLALSSQASMMMPPPGGVTSSTAAGTAAAPNAALPMATQSAAAGAKLWASQLRSHPPPPNPPPSPPTVPPIAEGDGSGGLLPHRGRTVTARRRPGDPESPPAVPAPQHTLSAPPRVLRALPDPQPAVKLSAVADENRPRPVPPAAGTMQQPRRLAEVDAKVLRDRVAEQMEKHRRRMVLGPRLSVFQLRDTQLDVLLGEEYNASNPPPQQPSVATLNQQPTQHQAAPERSLPPATSNSQTPVAAIPMRSAVASATLAHGAPNGPAVQTGRLSYTSLATAPLRTSATVLSNQAQPEGRDDGCGSGPSMKPLGSQTVVAISAATLQNHWLYHYDA